MKIKEPIIRTLVAKIHFKYHLYKNPFRLTEKIQVIICGFLLCHHRAIIFNTSKRDVIKKKK